MKHIVIAGGTLTSANKGCNALTRGTITALIENYGNDIDIKILSYSSCEKKQIEVELFNKIFIIDEIPAGGYKGLKVYLKSYLYKILPKHIVKKILNEQNEIFSVIEEADIIFDITEGDSFSDIYGLKRFITYSNIKVASINLRKTLILLPQTIGPFKNKFVKIRARYIMNKASYNFCRDFISIKASKELGVKDEKLGYMPDMAFYMYPDDKINFKGIKKNEDENSLVFGLNISGLLYRGGYTQNNMFGFKCNYNKVINRIIKWIMDLNEKNKIVLVPHVITNDGNVDDDISVSKEIYEHYNNIYPGRIFIVEGNYKEHELKKIISECDFFIGGRMHACIAGISTNIPTMPTAYSRKFIGIWNEFGLGEYVADPRKHSEEEILNILEKSYRDRAKIKEVLQEKNSRIKLEIRNGLNKFFE